MKSWIIRYAHDPIGGSLQQQGKSGFTGFIFVFMHILPLVNQGRICIKTKQPRSGAAVALLLRREGDSNPRSRGAEQRFSRPPRSTTLASLPVKAHDRAQR
jgi:hypothetical protein